MRRFTPPQKKQPPADKPGVASAPKTYLTFRLGRQDLAIDATRVRGILPFSQLLPLPKPGQMLGLAAFAGGTVAVTDIAAMLAIAGAGAGAQPKIVIVQAASVLVGFVADRVSDLVVYRQRNLHNGLLKGRGRPRRLIDLDALFAAQPLSPSNACSISSLASGVIAVSGNLAGPP